MANSIHLEQLESFEIWNAWRRENPEIAPDLSGADLRELFVRNANSEDQAFDLHGCDLSGCNLKGANLVRADLRGADLEGADLTQAKLAFTNLTDARLENVAAVALDLRGADVEGMYYRPRVMTCDYCMTEPVERIDFVVDPRTEDSEATFLRYECPTCGHLEIAVERSFERLRGRTDVGFASFVSPATRHLDPRPWFREHSTKESPTLVVPCPFCERDAFGIAKPQAGNVGKGWSWRCRCCGGYELDGDSSWLDDLSSEDRLRLTWGLRKASEGRESYPLSERSARALAEATRQPRDPFEAMEYLLDWVHQNTSPGGMDVGVSGWEYPVAHVAGQKELRYVLAKAIEIGWLEPDSSRDSESTAGISSHQWVRVSLEGWRHMAARAKTRRRGRQVFVAMSFKPEFDAVWSGGMKPAIEEAGLEALRLDELQHSDKICDRVVAEIRRSGALVADCSAGSGNVYFEAGLALGLDLDVIWTCRRSAESKLQFDTRQYPHILWDDPEDLREKLRDRLEATLVSALDRAAEDTPGV